MSCGVGRRHGSDTTLLWLWGRLAATALIRPLAWETPYTAGAALEKIKKKYIYIYMYIYKNVEGKYIQHKIIFIFTYLIIFLWLQLWHMEVPGLEVVSELQLPAYATATETQNLSRICDLHCSLRQYQILNPLSKARIEPSS